MSHPEKISSPPLGGTPLLLDTGSLRRVHLDLLGRPPYATEVTEWLGKERAALVDRTLSGEEYWGNWLEEQLYYFLLIDNFRPLTEGVQEIPALVVHRSLSAREALHRICLSSSFDRRNPGPDTFVTVVMEQLLGLTVQKTTQELEIGKRLYDGRSGHFLGRTGSSQADVVHIAVADDRALVHFLSREHERLLRALPAPGDLARWNASLKEDEFSLPSILREWFTSSTYDRRLATRRPEPNRLFIRALFVDLFGRLPVDDEAQRIRSALDGLADPTPLRSLVARLILDSGKAPVPDRSGIQDPAAWVRGSFERLLGRTPGVNELAVFLDAMGDADCRPATVLYAIVSHPEYQTW
ncbi:MAG: hypothetical protein EXS08_14670 [Planctomycetes bacterium]|nr:hypothetical protein [Planctomycetota bacterium]